MWSSAQCLSHLKMDLYTLIISHKSCNMLSILNKLIFVKGIANFCDKLCVFGQKIKTQQQNKKSNIKTLAGAGD